MKVVLAFSGGLDTSFCAVYLSKELGYDVHAVTVNTGGFSSEEVVVLEEKALSMGAVDFKLLDVTEEYYEKGIRFLLYGNVLKNNTYPLSVSAERVFQGLAIAGYAQAIGAEAIAHGSTGAGNDQVRFDLIFHSLCPDTEIITPIRDLALSRQEEIEYLTKQGITLAWEKAQYSINQGLWGTSVGGKETLTSNLPLPETAFPSQLTATEPTRITLAFEKGNPAKLNGESLSPVAFIQKLNHLGGSYAIGRDIHVGDTIVGIKGRVGFEAAGPMILIKAHHLLEKHVLTKQQLQVKDQLAVSYGSMMHEGLYLDPAMRNIETFFEDSQKHVTGMVSVLLAPYRFQLEGISSPFDLMQSKFGQYGEKNTGWSAQDARGFAKVFANQTKLYQTVHHGKD